MESTTYKSFSIPNEIQIDLQVNQKENQASSDKPISLHSVKFPIGWKIDDGNDTIILDDLNIINELNYILVKSNEVNSIATGINTDLNGNSFKLSNQILKEKKIDDFINLRLETRTWDATNSLFEDISNQSLTNNIITFNDEDAPSVNDGDKVQIVFLNVNFDINIDDFKLDEISGNVDNTTYTPNQYIDLLKEFKFSDDVNNNVVFIGFPFNNQYLKQIEVQFNLIMNQLQIIEINTNDDDQANIEIGDTSDTGQVSYDVKLGELFKSNVILNGSIPSPNLSTVNANSRWIPPSEEFKLEVSFSFPEKYEPLYTNKANFEINSSGLSIRVVNDPNTPLVVTNDFEGEIIPEIFSQDIIQGNNGPIVTNLVNGLYINDYLTLLTQEIDIFFYLIGEIVVDEPNLNSGSRSRNGISRNYTTINIEEKVSITPPIFNISIVFLSIVSVFLYLFRFLIKKVISIVSYYSR